MPFTFPLCPDDCGDPYRCHGRNEAGLRCGFYEGKSARFHRVVAAWDQGLEVSVAHLCSRHKDAPALWSRITFPRGDEWDWWYCLSSFQGYCYPHAGCVIEPGDLIAADGVGKWGHLKCWHDSGLGYPPEPAHDPKPSSAVDEIAEMRARRMHLVSDS